MSEPDSDAPIRQQPENAGTDAKKNETVIPAKVQRMIGKIVLLFFALLLLQVPVYLIRDLNESRKAHSIAAAKDVVAAWGGPQTLSSIVCGGSVPEVCEASAVIQPEIRRRGIYQSAVYTAEISARAEFAGASAREVKCSLSDPDGLLDLSAKIDGAEVPVSVSGNALSVALPAGVSGAFTVVWRLRVRGSGELRLGACGRRNDLKISGAWQSPDFAGGSVLPDTREIRGEHFSANWRISNFSAAAAAFDADSRPHAGVRLNITAGDYQQVERTMKYATFCLVVFFFTIIAGELFSKTEVHTLQYLVASGAPVLFYLMLLAVGEKTGFAMGYLISAAVTVVMVTGYAAMFLRRFAPALVMGAVFAAGYTVNYLILRMEQFALLSGTIVLAVILGILMLLTGRINAVRNR